MHFERTFCPAVESFRLRMRLRIEARINAREVSIAPSRLVRRIVEISSSSDLGRMFDIEIPAALTKISTFAYLVLSVLALIGLDRLACHFLFEFAHP